MFAVLGLGNDHYGPDGMFGRELRGKSGSGGTSSGFTSSGEPTREVGIDMDGPAKYYHAIGLHIGQFFWSFRTSLGDFHMILASAKLNSVDNYIFWMMWIMLIVVTSIIFLNFVVCEASASYNNVKESLNLVIIQAQANLIAESEDMSLKRFRNNDKYPKYYIVRRVDK